ncbi:AraC family transcriptional regulator [Paenibacillus sp. 1011MAR3C5]|uniref:AraC family transcriptional regulator n=1 Tax=Paenibacillus sp. 1011MAR3C5 TaxID=1675787 RepID=UPI000E6BCEB5|nr:AraC family transcriptional regulator [Paenibacillus sp. 1011MAR3C5]RJE88445.1 AraC family transcriptional regulator [Paenibacillus sp. 1011MAR3C5]
MDWVERMNQAIAYLEEHILDEINYSEVAKVAQCSPYHLQRMFPFITNVSLSEYIRRRRLTLAAFELQNGNEKVIDLSLKYGYESPEAFTRAFQQLHGTTPTNARNAGIKLKAYPRISFQITIKGVHEMDYRVEELGAFSVVGKQTTVNTEGAYNDIVGVWAAAREEGLFDELWHIRDSEHPMGGILGVCADGAWGKNDEFLYSLSIATQHEPPAGMVKREFAASTWVVFEVEGPPDHLPDLWRRLYTEWVPVAAFELGNLPAIEVYLPVEANKNELWVPVIRK